MDINELKKEEGIQAIYKDKYFHYLYILPYNLSKESPLQVYGYVYGLHIQAVTLDVGKGMQCMIILYADSQGRYFDYLRKDHHILTLLHSGDNVGDLFPKYKDVIPSLTA